MCVLDLFFWRKRGIRKAIYVYKLLEEGQRVVLDAELSPINSCKAVACTVHSCAV